MIHSWKAGACRACHKLRRQAEREAPCEQAGSSAGGRSVYRCPCHSCTGVKAQLEAGRLEHGCNFGKVVQPRAYTPYAGYFYDPAADKLVKARDMLARPGDPFQMLLATSVRIFDEHVRAGRANLTPAQAVSLPPAAKALLEAEGGAVTATGKRRRGRGGGGGGGIARALGSGRGELLPDADPRHALVEALLATPEVRAHFPEALDDLQKVVKLGDGKLRASMHLGHCKLAGREHSSNNTYMDITPGKIAQGCWDGDCRNKGFFDIALDTPPALFE